MAKFLSDLHNGWHGLVPVFVCDVVQLNLLPILVPFNVVVHEVVLELGLLELKEHPLKMSFSSGVTALTLW